MTSIEFIENIEKKNKKKIINVIIKRKKRILERII